MIRTLFFDIGNVLIRFNPLVALRNLEATTPYSAEEMAALLREWRRIWDFECGRLSTEEFFAEISSYLKLNGLPRERFEEIWSGIFVDETLIRLETVRSLKKNYRLVLISNTNAMHFGFIRARFPVVAEFDDAVLSFEVGAMKPAPLIFHQAVERAGCLPQESFFVDDLEENLQAARSLGIPGVRFQSEAQLLREFRRNGIL